MIERFSQKQKDIFRFINREEAYGHVVAVAGGDYFDTWDSGDEVPLYYWKKEE